MAAPLIPTQYASLHSGYYRCAQLPQPPPSPPVEDSRCSLPSISKLLGLADAGSPSAEPSSASHSDSSRPLSAARSGQQPPLDSPYIYADSRPGSSYAKPTPQQRGGMPPTPPMGTDTSFDGYHSPPSKPISQFSSSSAPARYYEPTPPLDADSRRHVSSTNPSRPPLQVPSSRHSISSASFSSQSSGGSSYQSLPPAASLHPQISNLFYQQPLPQSFPPLPVPMVLGPATGANPWQHHHYLTPSHGAAFPQNQDRYICQTCNKAFSRPSSLRIHSHSHTGEKPFKCPHSGCGKAFSVRSNMKRHERGCHSFGVSAARAAKAS